MTETLSLYDGISLTILGGIDLSLNGLTFFLLGGIDLPLARFFRDEIFLTEFLDVLLRNGVDTCCSCAFRFVQAVFFS